jgi:type IV secretory pathway VirB10-like protein
MSKNWFIAAIVVGVLAIAVAALLMRLTADDESSTTAWADSVCTALSDWRASIVSLTDVSSGLDGDSLRQKLDDAEDATVQLVSDLRDLGPPDVEAGDEVEQQLETVVGDLESQYQALKSDAEQAVSSADSPAALLQALAALAPQFQALLTSASSAVDDLGSANAGADAQADLKQAFAEAESCQELRSPQG